MNWRNKTFKKGKERKRGTLIDVGSKQTKTPVFLFHALTPALLGNRCTNLTLQAQAIKLNLAGLDRMLKGFIACQFPDIAQHEKKCGELAK